MKLKLFGKKKILIIVGGKIDKISPFAEAVGDLPVEVTLGSLSDINYTGLGRKFSLKLNKVDIKKFDVVYLRMIGRRLEDASLLADYARRHRVKIIDPLYEKERMLPSSLAKGIETRKLLEGGVMMPKTIYGSLEFIKEAGPKIFKYPYILKSTSGRKAREVWLINSEEEIADRMKGLEESEKSGIRYFGQEFIKAGKRVRALVVGGVVIGAITRPTKWNKMTRTVLVKGQVFLSKADMDLAIKAAKLTSLDICGVDILHHDETGKSYLIEANAAPSWKLVAKDCGVNVEHEILKYLARL